MRKIIDLSQKIYNAMPIYPGDKNAVITQNRFLESDKYVNTQMSIGMHVGTHIDTPSHLIEQGKGIESYELSDFIGKACVIDAFGKKMIMLKEEHKDKIKNSEIILFYTGYFEYCEKDEYYGDNSPVLSQELAEYLVNMNVKMIGLDLPSPDRYPYEIHKILLSNDVLIVENLRNLDKLLDIKYFLFQAMPLNINAEASVTRAVAIID